MAATSVIAKCASKWRQAKQQSENERGGKRGQTKKGAGIFKLGKKGAGIFKLERRGVYLIGATGWAICFRKSR